MQVAAAADGEWEQWQLKEVETVGNRDSLSHQLLSLQFPPSCLAAVGSSPCCPARSAPQNAIVHAAWGLLLARPQHVPPAGGAKPHSNRAACRPAVHAPCHTLLVHSASTNMPTNMSHFVK